MIVDAKCIGHCWDSTGAREYFSGFSYPLDLSKPADRKLAELKTYSGQFIFQFDREAATSATDGLFFCKECGSLMETLNAMGTHMRKDHKRTGWKEREPEPKEQAEPEEEVEETQPEGVNAAGDTRGLGVRHCKACGEGFPNLYLLMQHKPTCAAYLAKHNITEVAQGTPPA